MLLWVGVAHKEIYLSLDHIYGVSKHRGRIELPFSTWKEGVMAFILTVHIGDLGLEPR